MPLCKNLAEPAQRRQQLRLIGLLASAHSRWLDRLSAQYHRPRAELLAHFSANPGALEYEIALLISSAAHRKAEQLIKDRERPDEDSADLFDRAVCGHYFTLREAEFAQAATQVAELKSMLND